MSASNSPTPATASESSLARELQWVALVFLGTLVLLAVAVRLCGQDPLAAFGALWRGAFGSVAALSATASRAAILVFYAMGILLSFRAGILNIGAEGQSRVGASLACALAISTLGPTLASTPWIGIPILLAAGALAGAAWSSIAGLLRWWRGVPEVIATLMLNLSGLLLVKYLVSTHGLLREASSYPRSAPLADALQLGGWAQTEFHAGVFFALPLAVAVHFWLFKTPGGFHLRATGLNPTTSRACGISVDRVQLWTFAASGALAGFAGALALLARGRLDQEAAFPDFGYMAIAVALIARLKPLNVLPAATLFAGLDVGAKAMQATAGISYWIVYLVEGAIILAVLMRDSSLFSAKDAGPKSAAEAAA